MNAEREMPNADFGFERSARAANHRDRGKGPGGLFPLTPALSPGERENHPPSGDWMRAPKFLAIA